jgi:hypothetical protein
MKTSAFLAALMASAAFLPIQTQAAQTISFGMVKSNSINGNPSKGETFCPFTPFGWVVDRSFGTVEQLTVYIAGLPKNTDFVIFIIQVPNAPFGLAWYNGDIPTNNNGQGTGTFVGRFSKGTFNLSLAALPSPNTIPSPPGVLPDDPNGTKVGPVQIYHLGIWFNDPKDAIKAGCKNVKATPFTSNHDAGPQVLNTGIFRNDHGPLLDLQ